MIQGHNKHVYIFFKTIFREQCSFDVTENQKLWIKIVQDTR